MKILVFLHDAMVRFFDWAKADFWDVLLIAFLFSGAVALLLVSLSKTSPYTFRDNLVDENGKASFRHLAGGVALASTTWVFLKWGSLGTLPDWYGYLYFVTWALVLMVPRLADVIANVFASVLAARFGQVQQQAMEKTVTEKTVTEKSAASSS